MSGINLRYFTEKDQKKWDSYVKNHPDGTFFHLSGWKTIIETTFHSIPYYLLAEDGEKLKGIFPLFHVKSLLFGSSMVSVPFVVYGGICADDLEVYDLLLDEGKKLAQKLGVDYLELRNINQHAQDLPTKDLYFVFKREIFEDLDKNMAALPRKQRRMVRKGAKNDLQSIIDRDQLKEFYEIFAHSYRNLGSPVFPFGYLRNISLKI
jgi:FemAB-related protein (PEP-CTERM system-associated)